jgi:hypothetical protein
MGHLVVAGKAGRILPILPIADQLASGANIARGRARYFGNAITSRGIRDAASGFYGDSSPFLPHPTPPRAKECARTRYLYYIGIARRAESQWHLRFRCDRPIPAGSIFTRDFSEIPTHTIRLTRL